MSNNILGVEMKIDQEYIRASVEDIVKTAMVSALGNPEDLVRKAINLTVDTWVDSEGRPCKKDSYSAIPYIKYLAEEIVVKTIREAVRELVEENKEMFRKEFLLQIRRKQFGEGMVAAFLDVVLEGAKSKYNMPVSVNFEKQERD